MTFVITGSVEHFANRKELQAAIEAQGRQGYRFSHRKDTVI